MNQQYNQQKTGFANSVVEALKPSNIFSKLIIMLTLGIFLAGRELIMYGDMYMASGDSIFIAFYYAYLQGLKVAFASIYTLIFNFMAYIDNQAYFSLAIGIFLLYIVGTIVYQPVAIVFEMFSNVLGESTRMTMAILLTIALIVGISAYIHHTLGVESILTHYIVTPINETINQTITNSSVINEVPVIDLTKK